MRPFNEREKRIMKSLAGLDIKKMTTADRFLQDIFFTSESNRALIVKHDQKVVLYYTAPEVWTDLPSVRIALMELFEVISLLKYLKEQRLLDIFTTPVPVKNLQGMHSGFNETSKTEPNKLFLNKENDYIQLNDLEKIKNSDGEVILRGGALSDYYEMVYDNCFGLIFPNEAFYDFVKNDFKTEEDRKHKQNIGLSKFGIAVAIVLGLVGIGMQVLDKGTEKTNTLIEKTNSILESSNRIHKSIKLNIDTNTTEIKKLTLGQSKTDSDVSNKIKN